jgi:hypothetical protein
MVLNPTHACQSWDGGRGAGEENITAKEGRHVASPIQLQTHAGIAYITDLTAHDNRQSAVVSESEDFLDADVK